jgi:preprotein translocase subunit SecG
MLYYILATIYVLTCMVLMLVILLQQGKGGDIANAFGGGSSQAAFGARSGATVLSRATTIAAVIFMVGALVLGIVGQRGGGGSILSGRTPAPRQSAPAAPAPLTPASTPAPAAEAPAPTPAPAPATPPAK